MGRVLKQDLEVFSENKKTIIPKGEVINLIINKSECRSIIHKNKLFELKSNILPIINYIC